MMKINKIICSALLIAAVPSASIAQDLGGLFGPSMSKKELKKAIEKADESPLGSAENPVRVNMPPGQRAYLSKLRCSDGKAPKFSRDGSAGLSPFGNIMDIYTVVCENAQPEESAIYLDMYHPKHKEKRAVEGFTMS